MVTPEDIDLLVNKALTEKFPIWDDEHTYRKMIIRRKADLIYRYKAVIWNYNELKKHISFVKGKVIQESDYDKKVTISLQGHQPATHHFDNIVFNLVSLFDYLAALANVLIKNNQKYISWGGLTKFPEESEGFAKTIKEVRKVNSDFLDKLQSYRATLIHKKAESISIELNFEDLSINNDNFVYTTPEMLISNKGIRGLSKKMSSNDLTEGAFRLIETSYKHFEVILRVMLKDWTNS